MWDSLHTHTHHIINQIGASHLSKTYQGIICETEIKIAYIKKHVYKERKKTTYVEVGEENIHHHHIYKNKVQCM